MKISWKAIILYSLILLPIYAFTQKDSSSSLLGTKWYFYKEYSDPGGGGSWDRVSDADSKKYFELQKDGEVSGDYFFYAKYYTVKDSLSFELLDSSQKVKAHYSYTRYKDTLYISRLDYLCKEGCGWMFVKRD